MAFTPLRQTLDRDSTPVSKAQLPYRSTKRGARFEHRWFRPFRPRDQLSLCRQDVGAIRHRRTPIKQMPKFEQQLPRLGLLCGCQ